MDILEQLNKEKEIHQNNRHSFILRKITYVTALFGIGVIKIDQLSFYEVLYIIPLISIGFDIYILMEDYKIKRIGGFIKTQGVDKYKEWEQWVANRKNPYAALGAPLFTFITLFGSALLLLRNLNLVWNFQNIISISWFLLILACTLWLWKRSTKTRDSTENK